VRGWCIDKSSDKTEFGVRSRDFFVFIIMKITTILLIIITVLSLLQVFVIILGLFNNIKKLWYWKMNSGPCGFRYESMYYDAKKGKIEADQSPLH
jgi:hypothetical protein